MSLGSSPTFSQMADDLLFETRIKNRLLFKSEFTVTTIQLMLLMAMYM